MLRMHFKKHVISAALVGLGAAFGVAAQTSSPGVSGSGSSSSGSGSSSGGASTGSAGAMSSKGGGSSSGSAAGGTLAGADKTFVQKAAVGGLAEVQLGNLAQQKAQSDQVKQFGARMVQDHTKANDQLAQVASGKGVQVPTSLDSKHQKDMDRLNKMSGAQFDKAYMSHMVDDHKQDIADFKKEASGGKDADVKSFASQTLPILQEHLQMAQTTNDAVKKSGGK